MRNLIAIVLAVGALAGCGTYYEPIRLVPDPRMDAVVIVSVVRTVAAESGGGVSPAEGYSFAYRRRDSGVSGSFSLNPFQLPGGMWRGDFPSMANSGKGEVLTLQIPAGDYEIYSWHITSGYGQFSPVEKFSIPFTVSPGEYIYLGSLNMEVFYGTSLLRTRTPVGAKITLSDEPERDFAIAAKKILDLDTTKIKAQSLAFDGDPQVRERVFLRDE